MTEARSGWARAGRWLKVAVLAIVLIVIVVLVSAVGGAWLALRSEAGTARALAWVPGLKVIEPQGTLWGDFKARRIELELPRGSSLVLMEPQWRGLRWEQSSVAAWGAQLRIDRLQALSADLRWVSGPSSGPSKPPTAMDLPIGVRIDSLSVGRFQSNLLGAHPLTDITGRLVLQEASGRAGPSHEVVIDSLHWQNWSLDGRARMLTRSDMTLDASLLASSQASPKGQAKVLLRGPLTHLNVSAQVQVAQQAPLATATASQPASAGAKGQPARAKATAKPVDTAPQTLSADAEVAPFAPWPLPRAEVRAQHFDLQRLWAGLPMTSLTGRLDVVPRDAQAGAPGSRASAKGQKDAPASDLLVKVDMANERPGPWDAGAVPVVSVRADATLPAQADTTQLDALGLRGQVEAHVGLPSQAGRAAGTLGLQGRWDLAVRRQTSLVLTLQGVDTQVLHGQAPALLLKGQAQVQGQDDDSWRVQARVDGRDAGGRQGQVLREAVQAVLDGRWQPGRFDLADLSLTAGEARAQVRGLWQASASPTASTGKPADGTVAKPMGQSAPAPSGQAQPEQGASWKAKADLKVQSFDPAVWLPWPRPAGDAVQRTRLNGQGQVELTMPGRWQDLQGQGQFQLAESMLLGVPVSGDVKADQTLSGKGTVLAAQAQLKAAGNEAQAELRWPGGVGLDGQPPQSTGAHLQARIKAPALAGLQGWVQPLGWRGLTGQMLADVEVESPGPGRWATTGEMSAVGVRADLPGGGQALLDGAKANWTMGLGDAPATAKPWHLDAQVAQARWGQWGGQQFKALVQGMAAQHQWSWQGRIDLPERKSDGEAVRESALAQASGQSSWSGNLLADSDRAWHSRVNVFKVQPLASTGASAAGKPWLEAQPFEIDWRADKQGQRLAATPTRVDIFGAMLALRQLVWDQRGEQQGRSDVLLELEPLKLAEVLARLQPEAGWGGDLLLTGRVKATHQPGQPWDVDAVLARQDGDLSLTEQDIQGTTAQRLGVRQMKLALQARDGVWTATQQMEARVSGSIEGRQVIQTHDRTALPGADDPISGQIAAQVANVRALGVWAPPGWRLSGKLSAQAQLSGTLGAPQYEGRVQGQELGATQTLLGVHLVDGTLDLRLKGDHARLESLTARDGEANGGSLRLSGDAVLGVQPTATLQLQIERFALLQRVDRRVVVSGNLQLGLTEDTLSAQGQASVDEGLIDISQSDAPTIGDDVNVINRPGVSDAEDAAAAAVPRRKMQVALSVDLGSKLRLRGRGIDTHLRGALKVATPNGRPQITGAVSTVDGTYAAYGQKLVIERGSIAFTGPVDNPRLDIQAMRPQSPTASASDVKVGVLISGTAQDPRVRLYSEPTMSETEKLSWLVLGRGPTGLGGADIGLLQTAAAALLAGEGGSPTDNVLSAIGLDELSVRQSDGAVRETIVTVGKQISKKWYVGYERSLSTTEGTWQLIYRLAQRFTIRAQSGEDNAIDLIWWLRWN